MFQSLFCLLITVSLFINSFVLCDLQNDILYGIANKNGDTLSRKKRYLVFPEGSSFQLVFCLTYPSVTLGTFFVFGNTAALAWELPSTPLYFDNRDFEKKEEESDTQETTTTQLPLEEFNISSIDAHQKRIGSDWTENAYQKNHDLNALKWTQGIESTNFRPPVSSYYNPFVDFKYGSYSTLDKSSGFGVHNIDIINNFDNKENYRQTIQENNLRRYKEKSVYELPSQVDPMFYQIHRRTRRELYKKLETFLTAFNIDGKACLLKAICEVQKSPKEKGSFLEEMLKTVFRAKPHDDYPNEDHYDNAANVDHICDQLYPTCKGSVSDPMFLLKR